MCSLETKKSDSSDCVELRMMNIQLRADVDGVSVSKR